MRGWSGTQYPSEDECPTCCYGEPMMPYHITEERDVIKTKEEFAKLLLEGEIVAQHSGEGGPSASHREWHDFGPHDEGMWLLQGECIIKYRDCYHHVKFPLSMT